MSPNHVWVRKNSKFVNSSDLPRTERNFSKEIRYRAFPIIKIMSRVLSGALNYPLHDTK